jgi:hypothetical protein
MTEAKQRPYIVMTGMLTTWNDGIVSWTSGRAACETCSATWNVGIRSKIGAWLSDLQLNCYRCSPAEWFLVPSTMVPMTTLYSLTSLGVFRLSFCLREKLGLEFHIRVHFAPHRERCASQLQNKTSQLLPFWGITDVTSENLNKRIKTHCWTKHRAHIPNTGGTYGNHCALKC